MSETQQGIRVGDWVRFYQNGVLVIGQVEYVRPDPVFPESKPFLISTSIGVCTAGHVLEVRHADT